LAATLTLAHHSEHCAEAIHSKHKHLDTADFTVTVLLMELSRTVMTGVTRRRCVEPPAPDSDSRDAIARIHRLQTA
jgi:hypothetical protein